jgi:subtilase family serine protease
VTTLTVPLALDAGDYYLSAVVDSGGAVTELDEANNGLTAATQVTIGLVRPDLTVAILTTPATAQTGRPLRVNLRTRNLGQAAAPAFRVTFFMAAGDPTPGAGVPVGVRNFGSLAAGANASVTATITVPAALVPGDYYLSALADTGGTVIELDEANNGRTAPALVTVALYRPDLRLTALTGPAGGVVVNGRSMIVSSTARNVGPAPAGAFRIAFYLSADTTLDAGDILLGTRRVGSLAADAVSTATSTLAIPPLTPPFDYYLIAAVDDLQIVAELGEDDNVLATATTVAVLPNLARDTTTNLTLTFSHCTDPDLDTSGSGPVRFRVPVHTTGAFTASSGFTESAQGITLVTTFTFAGTVDVRGVVTGTYIMRTTVPGFGVVFSSTGSLTGEVFGPQLSGSFAGVLKVFTGDDCQLTAGFSGS